MASISNLFSGHAPFKHLQAHMRVVHDCAKEVVPLVEALIAGDREAVAEADRRIAGLEGEADKLKHVLRIHLPRSLFMPVDRRDLLEVLHQQDSIADTAEDISGIFVQRSMTVPEGMREDLMALTRRCVEVVGLCSDIIEHLDELLSVGFRGRTAQQVERLALQLNEAEDETDALERKLERTLFSLESELHPVTAMFWYRVIEWIGDLADHAEKVANTIRLIIAR